MRKFTKTEVAEFYRRLAESRPIPQTELEFINPFTLLVAVVLSAQATDVGVNKATPALFALADTPAKMVALGEARVTELIRTIGLFRTKARNIIALSRILVERHRSQVPRDREALETLPGVGRKTANVVLNVAFGEPTIAVDTHIFRVGNRTGLAPGKTPLAVEAGLDLVEIAPNSEPPVCKILDYGKYKYQAQKKAAEARKKQRTVEIKEIKMRPNIDSHDYEVKMRSIRRFFEEGDKVKVTLRFRGREMAHQELGAQLLDRVKQDTLPIAKVESEPRLEGRQMVMILAPR
jgi:endonuclease-3